MRDTLKGWEQHSVITKGWESQPLDTFLICVSWTWH